MNKGAFPISFSKACGGVPVLTSPAALLEIETMDEWEAEVEISPCLSAEFGEFGAAA